jgi:hypothetical protein
MTTSTQPEEIAPPSLRRSSDDMGARKGASPTFGQRLAHAREKVTTRHGWFGDYDYAWLCLPAIPCMRGSKRRRNTQPPFYALDQELPLILAITTGLQHSLAMLAGVFLWSSLEILY